MIYIALLLIKSKKQVLIDFFFKLEFYSNTLFVTFPAIRGLFAC